MTSNDVDNRTIRIMQQFGISAHAAIKMSKSSDSDISSLDDDYDERREAAKRAEQNFMAQQFFRL